LGRNRSWYGFTDICIGGRRGHDFKLFKGRVRLEVGKEMFNYTVCEMLNELPYHIVGERSVNVFERQVNSKSQGYQGTKLISVILFVPIAYRWTRVSLNPRGSRRAYN